MGIVEDFVLPWEKDDYVPYEKSNCCEQLTQKQIDRIAHYIKTHALKTYIEQGSCESKIYSYKKIKRAKKIVSFNLTITKNIKCYPIISGATKL